MKGIRLITSDACIGLAESAAEFFPDAAWQRCVVHWYRNIFSHVPSTKVREIAAMLKAIHASEDLAAAREKANRVIEKLRGLRLSRAAELVETAVEETLTYYAFPEEHWRRIRTNNPSASSARSRLRLRASATGALPAPVRSDRAQHKISVVYIHRSLSNDSYPEMNRRRASFTF